MYRVRIQLSPTIPEKDFTELVSQLTPYIHQGQLLAEFDLNEGGLKRVMTIPGITDKLRFVQEIRG